MWRNNFLLMSSKSVTNKSWIGCLDNIEYKEIFLVEYYIHNK